MLGAEVCGGDACKAPFIVRFLAKTDGEGLHCRSCAGHAGNDGRRIDPARQESPERHVRDEAVGDRLVNSAQDLLLELLPAGTKSGLRRWWTPVTSDHGCTVGLDGHHRSG